jgi:S-formylglutathione hydrolase FrmB
MTRWLIAANPTGRLSIAARAAIGAGLLGSLSAPNPTVSAQGMGQQTRADRTPIDLPGGSRVEFHSFETSALRGSGEYSIFLPPSYSKSSGSFPVVYFLHGLFNDHTSWTVSGQGDLAQQVEELMRAKTIPEMLLLHPNGDRSFYTNYADGSLRYEDFVVHDLVQHVERKYRAKKGRNSRAVAGTSMGGYGALKIAMKHPERYAAVAAHSAIIFLGKNPLDVPPAVRQSRRFEFFTQMFSAIYGSPIDQAHYDANNVLLLARRPEIKSLGVYFDYGTADRYNETIGLGEGLRKLDEALTQAGVPHTFREHPGEPHGWELVARHIEESLRFVSRTF